MKMIQKIRASFLSGVAKVKTKASDIALSLSVGFMSLSAGSALAAAPTATATNTQAAGATAFIIDILQGEIGYLLALIAFAAGIVAWFKTKEYGQTLGCFALAILIIIVPGALSGFFS